MDPLKLPKQEEVTEYNLGGGKTAKLVRVTDENYDALIEIALSMYIGEKCKYCLREFTSVLDIRAREVVYTGYHEHGRTACRSCWNANNPNQPID